MSEFRLSPEAEAELDRIWIDIARESGSVDTASFAADNYVIIHRVVEDDVVLVLLGH